MLTASGVLVLPDNDNAPTLDDIALGLSRAARFGGQGRCWWSVLDHSFVVMHLVREALKGEDPVLVATAALYALLHDAHEAVTGDVPTPWKPKALKVAQAELDRRIYARFKLEPPTDSTAEQIRVADRQALVAEAFIVGPENLGGLLVTEGWTKPEKRHTDLVAEQARRWNREGKNLSHRERNRFASTVQHLLLFLEGAKEAKIKMLKADLVAA